MYGVKDKEGYTEEREGLEEEDNGKGGRKGSVD